jgi:hypothetical protein
MKRKKLIFWIVCLLILVSVVLFGFSGFETSTRHSVVQSNIVNLAVYIELFRQDTGKYPVSLDELSEKVEIQGKSQIRKVLNDQWNDHYEYQPRMDGFVIVAVMPRGWFVKKEQFERKYKIGEALKSFNSK